MTKYKMLVSDFDGTLLRSDHTVSPSTAETIKRFIDNGGKFVVCTGRMAKSIRPILKNLGISGDVLCCQGSVLCDIDSGEIKMDEGIDWRAGAELIKKFESENEHVQTYFDGEMYTAFDDVYTEFYEKGCNIKANLIDCRLSEYVEKNKKKLNKILMLSEPDKICCYYEKYKDYGEGMLFNISDPRFLEAVSVNFTKGMATERIARAYGIDISEVVAVGDSLNDMTLMEHSGLSVAVANADERLKAAAKLVTVSNDENAVELLLKKYCLGE